MHTRVDVLIQQATMVYEVIKQGEVATALILVASNLQSSRYLPFLSERPVHRGQAGRGSSTTRPNRSCTRGG
jgi:hypothetical protein